MRSTGRYSVGRARLRSATAMRLLALTAVASTLVVMVSSDPAGATWHDVTVSLGLGPSVSVSLTPTSPSNCTRDETNKSLTTTGVLTTEKLFHVSKADGSCAFERSYNTWNVTLPGGGAGQIFQGQRDLYGFYSTECAGSWTKYSCRVPYFSGYNPYSNTELLIGPPVCSGTVAVGSACTAAQPDLNSNLSFTSGLALDNHNYLTIRNVGKVGCVERNQSRPRFLAAGAEENYNYNVGGTQEWVSAYDQFTKGKVGVPCIMTFTAHRS